MMMPRKSYMPLIFLVCGVSFIPAYGSLTLTNVNIEMNDSNLNVTSITVDSLVIDSDGIQTRFTSSDNLHKYQFDRKTTDTVYDLTWDSITSEFIQFTVTDVITDARGNVTGVILGDVELDDVSTAWSYTTKNIIDIDEAEKIEYIFAPPPTHLAIVLSLNSPLYDRLGGVFAITCPTNSTLTGLLTNGTFVCSPMSDFFP